MAPSSRVVITGIGMLSPLGLDAETTWQRLVAGESGIDYITLFDTTGHTTTFGGEVKGFEPGQYLSVKEVKRTDRFSQLAVAAAQQALADSGLELTDDIKEQPAPLSAAASAV
jgi:3-oxoacyl-[acyl-carrier-protein] synthase II